MKFLIQTVNKKVVHDFSFTLLESIKYMNWYSNSKDIKYRLTDKFVYNKRLANYIPIGSVEFVTDFINTFYGKEIKPRNVPESLFLYANRNIINGTEKDITGEKFVKSNDKIKSFTEICKTAPKGNYQISDLIEIESEWRCFVFDGKLVGLQNYAGDFTLFPSTMRILSMISNFEKQPIAYTLDVGVTQNIGTFIIEVHDFFSCGLYGFANHQYYIKMLSKWFWQFVK